jgi:hypothetical protein
MVLPAVAFPGQRPQDLQGLNALFAKPAAVQRHGAGCEIRIRQEGLHDTDGAHRQRGINTYGRLGWRNRGKMTTAISRLSAEMKTVLRMPDYAKSLEESDKVTSRYHIVGYHGGAWIFNVESNDELEILVGTGTRLQFLALLTSIP